MSDSRVKSVTWLVRQISACLDSDPVLHGVVLEAEISNFHAHSSGHWYFSLKDERSRIDATMWRNDNAGMTFLPKDGDKVRVLGSVTVYAVQGKMQFTVKKMARAGEGDLKAKFDALYKALAEEGLFDPAHKKPIPKFPLDIALITGSATHARADVYNTLARRWPLAKVTEYPVLVQGESAPPEIIDALLRADRAGHEVILLCRGGGSAEDLWCFNDEMLARTIWAIRTPLITGVGHEPDWTMVDYVADLRAPTPTGAAERATPDIRQVHAWLLDMRYRLNKGMNLRLETERERLEDLKESRVYADPLSMIREQQMQRDLLEQRFLRLLQESSTRAKARIEEKERAFLSAMKEILDSSKRKLEENRQALNRAVDEILEADRHSLEKNAQLLDAYSPLKVLGRGYSVVVKNSEVLRDAANASPGETIEVRLHRGRLLAEITETIPEE
jgi:exodeoxyribonuclease VII large subunit